MAPKRSTPLDDPPAASSEEEEESSSGEEEDGEEEEGSSSEEEGTQGKPQKPSSQPASQIQTAKPVHKKPDSESESDESDSESDSDADRPNHARDATVKPIASKPMEETPTKTTKLRSKPSASSSATAKSTAAVKRASESDRDPKDSKRGKKKDSESDGVVEKSEDTKKQLFQRLWSEDDEIAVLKGIIDFTEKKGTDPSKDMTSFHDFIKKSLHFDVSLSQLKDKVWRLKKKFENHVSKGKKGEDKTFSKAHDQKSFDLSKKIWGSEAISGGGVDLGVKSNGKAKKNGGNNQRSKSFATLKAELGLDVEETEKVDKMEVETESHSSLKQILQFDRTVSVAGMEECVVKRGLDMLEGAKKAEMEEKWRQLHVAELELFLKRNELIREQAKLMLAAYKTE
ncbi:GLABROUS1 enhancer-binding protein-like [Manihot esculenta]|uniref:Uncharacterized protein n=3 Tax=Manihot esculenta TaxID=3983 RepID=A0ACB7G4Z1_MANES|nr:GLABROUS1 enhancer-binding protein-like [Manihot esculenta]KAG8635274.1 hypothetical protein MANES_16G016900v8 [Manihot esculenta]KAG8635275.1 hypothetical protein MANES_16G016900v8 [Manihot esculenta]OAY26041.1 hypothetical protein MANES_16G016900v8 [Manihot esculenta]